MVRANPVETNRKLSPGSVGGDRIVQPIARATPVQGGVRIAASTADPGDLPGLEIARESIDLHGGGGSYGYTYLRNGYGSSPGAYSSPFYEGFAASGNLVGLRNIDGMANFLAFLHVARDDGNDPAPPALSHDFCGFDFIAQSGAWGGAAGSTRRFILCAYISTDVAIGDEFDNDGALTITPDSGDLVRASGKLFRCTPTLPGGGTAAVQNVATGSGSGAAPGPISVVSTDPRDNVFFMLGTSDDRAAVASPYDSGDPTWTSVNGDMITDGSWPAPFRPGYLNALSMWGVIYNDLDDTNQVTDLTLEFSDDFGLGPLPFDANSADGTNDSDGYGWIKVEVPFVH